jgi:eukaryotic-like serine/threonine-protein kinase
MTQMGQLPSGSKCDRYEIVRLIGAGGMGEVYMALHEFTKKPVALKVLKVTHAAKEQHVEKMRAEAMLLCRIKHKNLVEVYDAGIADVTIEGSPVPLIWMAMELLEGESFRERLHREGAIRPGLALEWTAQVADGVHAAHMAGVVHRDLKPENIFMTKKGEVRVLDFGTAKFQGFGHKKTMNTDRVGTVPYMSPEHLAGDDLDGRSDIYALGLILYEMLAGRHPFSNEQGAFPPMDQLIGMQLGGDPDSLAPYVGDDVWRVVERAVHKEVAARYPSMEAMGQACRAAAAPFGERTGALRLSGTAHRLGMSGLGASGVTPAPLATSTPGMPAPTTGVSGGALAVMALVAMGLGGAAVFAVGAGEEVGAAVTTQPDAEPTSAPADADDAPVASKDPSEDAGIDVRTNEGDTEPATTATAVALPAPPPPPRPIGQPVQPRPAAPPPPPPPAPKPGEVF